MTESTLQHDEMLVSLIHQGLDEADRPPADVTAFAKAVFSWRTIEAELAWVSYNLPNEEMSPDE
jgi:hypothetical protein